MNGVLVDTSVWISYFRGVPEELKIADGLDYLLSGDEVFINEIVLSELIPAMTVRRETKVIELIKAIRCLPTAIDWEDIRRMQIVCLKNGINKVGLPDLIIAQQAIRNGIPLFSLDKHFRLMVKHLGLKLWP